MRAARETAVLSWCGHTRVTTQVPAAGVAGARQILQVWGHASRPLVFVSTECAVPADLLDVSKWAQWTAKRSGGAERHPKEGARDAEPVPRLVERAASTRPLAWLDACEKEPPPRDKRCGARARA